MPARAHAGITFGFLWSFKLNSDIWTELAWSRDGLTFERLQARPRLLDPGPPGAWDDGMVFGSPDWIEVGDEWWLYYAGWDGPHGIPERDGSIGLATLRKEGFVSLRGPRGGGVVCTRTLRWPGGDLLVNVDAHAGEMRVRVSDERRRPMAGYDYADMPAFAGDRGALPVKWGDRSLEALKGQTVRLEFQLREADLYTFRAAGSQ